MHADLHKSHQYGRNGNMDGTEKNETLDLLSLYPSYRFSKQFQSHDQ